jgi:two-component system response regulator QseB
MAIRMRVLLLEDHTALREMIGDHLTQRGFAVDGFGRGDEASAAAAVAAYDAIILDLGLPDVDGMEVLATIRAVRAEGALPAVIVTARDAVDDRVRGLNAGADDYLVKPFALVELEARLRAVLRRPGQRTEVVYSCGSLTFDPASRVAAVSERVLDLSRRESALLEELLRARGRVVIKDVLEERLYGFDEAVSRNALEATVSRLRRSLGECGAGVRIETKRGIGYRLIAEEPR